MDLPGPYVLAVTPITAPLSAQAFTPIVGLNGMASVTLEAELQGGTGGSAVTVRVQSRIGSSGTWREIARFDFTGAAAKSCTIATGAASVAALTTLNADAVLQGFLGTDLQAVVTSTGTYAGTVLAVRAAVR